MGAALRTTEVGPYRLDCPIDGATVLADESYRHDGTRPGALVCHSAGQRHHQQAVAEWWPVPRALAESGMCVCLACDLGDPTVEQGPTSAAYSWGNDNALRCLSAAHRFLAAPVVGARPGRTLVVGTSMGALLGLNWALRHRDLVGGMILACPVLDLAAVARGPMAQSVAAAYGVADPAQLYGHTHHCPVAYAPRLAGLPIRLYASRDDPVAADTRACEAFASSVGGDAIDVVDLGPSGHWPIKPLWTTPSTSPRPSSMDEGGREPTGPRHGGALGGVSIQLVSAWNDPSDRAVWSGTIASLLEELGALGVLGTPSYRDVTPWGPAVRALRTWLRGTRRLSAAWAFSREMQALTRAVAWRERLRSQPGANAFLLPMGALGRPVGHPFATWCDMSPAQIAAAYPEHTASFGYFDVAWRDLSTVLAGQVSVYRAADHCLAVSHWAADSLVRDHGVSRSRVHVVGAGRNVTTEAFGERDWATPRFLFVGNSWERKNGPAVVRAFGQVRSHCPGAELHLVGRHPRVSADGVTGHGQLFFAEPDEGKRLQELFQRATCLVVPSLIEPFGIVYVEAGAAGLPSIGTTVGGAATAVGSGGILVDPHDEGALVAAMTRLTQPEQAMELGRAARTHSASFTWRACAERVVRAFAPNLADSAGLAAFL